MEQTLTWQNCDAVDGRFKKLLADPFEKGEFQLLPKQQPRTRTLDIVWQLRHTIVHNVGVLTRSDASKLRIMLRREVQADRVLEPTRHDLRFLTKFLDDVAVDCNRRIGERLAELMTVFHETAPLFEAGPKAEELSRLFGIRLTVAGVAGALPTQAP